MRMRSFAGVIIAAAVTASTGMTAYAYEAPQNIELSIGTAELNKEDIHGDTIVKVPIYIQNNPGLLSVKMVFEADSGLRFDGYHSADSDNTEVASVNIYQCSGTDRIVSVNFTSIGTDKMYSNGEIAYLRFVVSEDTPAGRYAIRFTNGYDDEYMGVLSENSADARFGIEVFSKLEQGAVIINAPDVPAEPAPAAQAPAQAPQEQDNAPAPVQDEQAEEESPDTPTETTEAVTSSAAETTTSAVSVSSEKSETTSGTSAETTETSLTAEQSTSETTLTTAGADDASAEKTYGKGKEKRAGNRALIPAAAAAVIAAGAGIAAAARKKRGNNNE